MMNTPRSWKSKKDRRDAAVAFLQKTLTDPDVRSAVLKDRQAAHRILKQEGGIDIPNDVEVICVGPSTQERDRLVVFVLPPEGTPTEHLNPFKYWTGTWQPYGVDPVTDSFAQITPESSMPEPSLK
jgi:hypothetical protein